MIKGIGIDMCDVARIEKLMTEKGDALAQRILTPEELEKGPYTAVQLAKRFAVKEAVSKALGSGIGAQCSFQDITLTHASSGQPRLMLSSNVHKIFGPLTAHVSITHEKGLAAAYVVLEEKSV